MKRRTLDEMITYFNQQVSEMDIKHEDRIKLLGMITAIGYEASAEPEHKTGKWTKGSDMPPMKYRNGKPKKFWPSFRYCSVCGHEAFDDSDWGEQLFNWCPYCGTKMEG